MGSTMHWLMLFLAIAVASCGAPNPEFCCVTEDQCAAAGVTGELRPCDVGQACNSASECVAQECVTSAECTSLDRPSCENGLCVAGCAIDDDCLGISGASRCDATTGECVGCVSNDQCPAEAEICDTETRSCRGCTGDEDCGGGICVEATGVCVDAEDAVYVTDGGVDTGDCPKPNPCASIQFALGRVTNTRNVIKILSASLNPSNTSINLQRPVRIDATGNTRLTLRGNPGIAVSSVGTLIEGVSLRYEGTGDFLSIEDGAEFTLFAAVSEESALTTSRINGELVVVRSEFQKGNSLACELGKLAIRESRIIDSVVDTSGCTVNISRSHFVRGVGSAFGPEILRLSGGLAAIENNLIVQTEAGANSLSMSGHVSGSVFRFNTLVHTTTTPDNTTGIACSGIELTSNVLALNSSLPISPNGGCSARNTLFDLTAGTQPGENNQTADAATFFLDRSAGDYHLAPDSPAKTLGEPGMVELDFDGNPRPSDPDSGAFEAP